MSNIFGELLNNTLGGTMNSVQSYVQELGLFWLKITASLYILTRLGMMIHSRIHNRFFRLATFCVMSFQIQYGYGIFYQNLQKEKNLFELAGVNKLSSSQTIRKAYREYARDNHPDKIESTPQSRLKYTEMTEIFQTLIDSDKKFYYDKFNEQTTEKFTSVDVPLMHLFHMIMKYFQLIIFSFALFPKYRGIDDKNKILQTTAISFIYSIYNVTIRNKYSKDPLDYIFPNMAIFERQDFQMSFMPIQFGLARVFFLFFNYIPLVEIKARYEHMIRMLNQFNYCDDKDSFKKDTEKYMGVIDKLYVKISEYYGLQESERVSISKLVIAQLAQGQNGIGSQVKNQNDENSMEGDIKSQDLYKNMAYNEDNNEIGQTDDDGNGDGEMKEKKSKTNQDSGNQQSDYGIVGIVKQILKFLWSIAKSMLVVHFVYSILIYLAAKQV